MKKNLKKLTAFALAICAAGTITAIAKENAESITAVYRNIKLVVDGVLVEPKDADGNVVEPFIYDGTTYLPVRAVANAFDKSVEWDGENAKVVLDTKGENPQKELTLWNRSYSACSNPNQIYSKVDKAIGYMIYEPKYEGEEISDNRYFRTDSLTYALNGKASRLSGEFYVSNGYGAESQEGVLKICNAGGKVLWTSPIMRKSTDPAVFDLSVANETEIKFVFETTSGGSHNHLVIRNAKIMSSDY